MQCALLRAHMNEIWLSQTRTILGEVGLKERVRDTGAAPPKTPSRPVYRNDPRRSSIRSSLGSVDRVFLPPPLSIPSNTARVRDQLINISGSVCSLENIWGYDKPK